jgi:hypothetical protein
MLSELIASEEDCFSCGTFSPITDLTKSSIFSPFLVAFMREARFRAERMSCMALSSRVEESGSGNLNRFCSTPENQNHYS